jgi:hypothetical protein
MQLPDISNQSLIDCAGRASLVLLLLRGLWSDLAHVVSAIWRSCVEAVGAVEAFRNRHAAAHQQVRRSSMESSNVVR